MPLHILNVRTFPVDLLAFGSTVKDFVVKLGLGFQGLWMLLVLPTIDFPIPSTGIWAALLLCR